MMTHTTFFDTRFDTSKNFVPMTINFKLRNYINSEGLSPVYLNVNSRDRRVRLNLDVFVKAKYWNKKEGKLFGPVEEVHDDNLILDDIRSKINNIKINYRLSSKTLTIDSFIDEFTNEMPRANFVAFFKKMLELNQKTLHPNTYKKEKAIYTKLHDFRKEIIFCDIDQHFFVKYRSHMASLGNSKTTRNNNIKIIKKYLRCATKMGIKLTIDLEDVRSGSTKGNRTYLNAQEIKACYKLFKTKSLNPKYKLVLGYFLFSCFTGLRISDVESIKRQFIKNNSYTLNNVKGNKLQVINFNAKARAIIEECPDLFIEKLSQQYINRTLKTIMLLLNINKKVSFHVARHSFATNLILLGCPVTEVQKLLNHSDIKDTMTYVHLAEQEKNNTTDLLDTMFK